MDETSVLIAKSQSGDKEAREILIEKNLGLVHHIVRRFAGRGYEQEDLFQIGTIGLMKAVDNFDLSLELKFSTYAVPMITGEIKRFMRDDGIVKVSRSIKENGIKIHMARQILQNSLGREPSLSDIADHTGLSEEEIVMAMEADITVESLYSSTCQDDGNEMYLVDRVVQGESGCVGRKALGESDSEKDRLLDRMLLKQLLGSLDSGERELIYLRYFQDKTQTEIAKKLGMSQVQVSRMEKRILNKMRTMCV
jgi:RNA polymerase sporulation-specific sigma factor